MLAQVDSPQLPPVLKDIGIEQHLGRQLPLDTVFRDEGGRAVRLGDYFQSHRPVVLTLVYLKCPMLCTVVLNDTLRSLRELRDLNIGRDFDVLTVSFDPREGPDLAAKKKATYVGEYHRDGAEAGWHFLTGDEASILRPGRRRGVSLPL